MSSSSSTEIPECIWDIFNNPKPEDWFIVYYLTGNRQVIAKHTFLYQGRHVDYKQRVEAERTGRFHCIFIVFQGRSSRHFPNEDYQLIITKPGEHFYMSFKGDLIP